MPAATDVPDLTTTEVAEQLRVHENTVYRWLAAKEFPGAYQLPGRRGEWRIPQASLDGFRQKREVAS